MSVAPAEIVRQLLLDRGVAAATGAGTAWTIVAGPFPLTGGSDNMISVQDTGAWWVGRIHPDGKRDAKPTVSLTIRSLYYLPGYLKGSEVEAVFDSIGVRAPYGTGAQVVTVRGTGYSLQSVHLATSTTKVGVDEEKRRQLFTVNARLTIGATGP